MTTPKKLALTDTADKRHNNGTFHVPSTGNPGKRLNANGTAERACYFGTWVYLVVFGVKHSISSVTQARNDEFV